MLLVISNVNVLEFPVSDIYKTIYYTARVKLITLGDQSSRKFPNFQYESPSDNKFNNRYSPPKLFDI